jgi:glycosyltransferase involved in cell wall biosynthesis
MKIAFVLTQSLDSPSGLGRYGPLARELVKLGYDVEVIALHYNWEALPQKTFVEQGVQVKYVGQMHVQKEGSHKIYFGPIKLLKVSLNATVQLAKAVRNSNSDIIHLGKPQPFNVLAALYGHRGRPLFCDCDDYEAETNRFSHSWQKLLVKYFEDSIIHFVDGLTVNTRFLKNRYQQLGFPVEKILFVPNGVEQGRFANISNSFSLLRKWGLNKDSPIVIYVGTVGLLSHPVDLLLTAFCAVLEACPNAQLLLVGGGEDYAKVQEMARQLGIARQTTFTGRVRPEEIPAYLSLADVSVDPVHDDLIAKARSPLKIIESLVVGTPVVTGLVGDRDIMLENGRLGELVEAGNSSALAHGILAILQNPEKREAMSQTALTAKSQWYWDRLVTDFSQIYQSRYHHSKS